MIYLRTGANGTGKTLLTLKEVYDKAIKEARPVYHNGRFAPAAGGPLSSWTELDIKDWQSVPDGAIFVVDECHNDFPVRSSSAPVPEYVRMLAEHRRRGFDFYLITQHPGNIDAFVRRLIGAPGFHQHLKRVSGAPLVSVLEWPAVNDQPQKNGSGSSAAVKMVSYPKEVYSWYESTSLNTAKVKIPFQAKLLAACVLLVPVLMYYGWTTFQARQPYKPAAATPTAAVPGTPVAPPGQLSPAGQPVQTPQQYLASFQPRIDGLPHTAPRYDEATKPTTAPFPAACVSMGSRCDCYTQQGTKLQTSAHLCKQIVAGGFFQDWGTSTPSQAQIQPALPVQPSEKLTGGNPGIAPSVAVVTKSEQNVASAARDGEVFARIGRVGGGTRPATVY
nr:zonular occludens toxin domain-containing protein [uncultured Rhodoferax sp.]